jgi:beta-mannosidase
VHVPARGGVTHPLAEGLDGFMDLSYAYRFGPPPFSLVHVRLLGADGAVLGEAFHFPAGMPSALRADVGLVASVASQDGSARCEISVSATGFAQNVHLELEGYVVADDHFHLAPGSVRRIQARRVGTATERLGRGFVTALNSNRQVPLSMTP